MYKHLEIILLYIEKQLGLYIHYYFMYHDIPLDNELWRAVIWVGWDPLGLSVSGGSPSSLDGEFFMENPI